MMQKAASFLLGMVLLFSVRLFADEASRQITDLPAQLFGDVEWVVDGVEPLYIPLARGAVVGDHLRFEILVDGELSLTEEVELIGTSAANQKESLDFSATPVVEFLATAPARLDFLRRAAVNGTVEVISYLGATKVGNWVFADLEAESALLRTEGALPYDLSSKLTLAAPTTVQNKYSCHDICDWEQDDCYLNQCGQFGSASCYNACDDQWVQCMEGCGVCQPSSSTQVTETVVSTTPTSTTACKRSFFNSTTGTQRLMNRRIKRTTTTTTTNSNCTQTVSTSVSYYNTTCWKWINLNSCSWVLIENPAANC